MSAFGSTRTTVEQTIQQFVGGCREWVEDKHNCCFEPAEYVLWGKLIPPEGLGPRCYAHARQHVSDHMLHSRTTAAVIHIGDLSRAIEKGTV